MISRKRKYSNCTAAKSISFSNHAAKVWKKIQKLGKEGHVRVLGSLTGGSWVRSTQSRLCSSGWRIRIRSDHDISDEFRSEKVMALHLEFNLDFFVFLPNFTDWNVLCQKILLYIRLLKTFLIKKSFCCCFSKLYKTWAKTTI